jgi:hypothetical protein
VSDKPNKKPSSKLTLLVLFAVIAAGVLVYVTFQRHHGAVQRASASVDHALQSTGDALQHAGTKLKQAGR